jgi:hypothetical protein
MSTTRFVDGRCGPGQFVWRPAGNQHEAVAPNGAVLLGFFLKPNRFAYGESLHGDRREVEANRNPIRARSAEARPISVSGPG